MCLKSRAAIGLGLRCLRELAHQIGGENFVDTSASATFRNEVDHGWITETWGTSQNVTSRKPWLTNHSTIRRNDHELFDPCVGVSKLR